MDPLRPGDLNEDLPAVRLPRPVQGPARPRGLLAPITSVRSTRAWSCRSIRATPAVRHAVEGVSADEQANEFAFVRDLNQLSAVEYPEDDQLRARIRAYELAYRMQRSVPEVVDLARETPETQRLYGIDQEDDGGLRPPSAGRPPPGRARGPVRAGLPQRLRRVGFARRSSRTCTPGRAPGSTGPSRVCSGT